MDWQQAASVLGVLLMLGGLLFWLQRKGVARIGAVGRMRPGRRMESIERLMLAPNQSLHLIRIGGRVLLIGVSPSGCIKLDDIPPQEVELRIDRGPGTI